MYLVLLYDFPLLPNIAIHQTRYRNELISASSPFGEVMAALEGLLHRLDAEVSSDCMAAAHRHSIDCRPSNWGVSGNAE